MTATAPNAWLVLNDANGTKRSILTLNAGSTGLLYLQWRLQRNGIHWCEFALDADYNDLQYLTDKAQIEIWREYPLIGLAPYKSFEGLLRDFEYVTDDLGLTVLTCKAYGYLSMLGWRDVLYDAGLTNRSKFNAPAETVFKTLVNYNAGPYAQAIALRDRDGIISGLSVETDQARGNTLTLSASRDNLLEVIKKYAGRLAGGDIDIIKLDATSYEFRFYPGQRGSDKSLTVVFSLDRANMKKPKLTMNHSQERTIVVAGGKGQETDRLIALAYGPNYSSTNDVESFYDDSQTSDLTTLGQHATQAANDAALRRAFTFEIMQTTNTAVDLHYFLGDIISARYVGLEFTKIVDAITFIYAKGKETVSIDTADI